MRKVVGLGFIGLLIFSASIIFFPKAASADFCDSLYGLSLYSIKNKQYLGKFVGKYETDSIADKYGDYGSKYEDLSIFNPYGEYGSKYEETSPWDKYSDDGPVIVDDSLHIYGTLTINQFASNPIHPIQALTCIVPFSDERFENYTWALDEFDGYKKINTPDSSSDIGYVPNYPSTPSTPTNNCPANSKLIGSSCYCLEGYKASKDGNSCVVDVMCPENSTLVGGSCQCRTGYISRNAVCMTPTQVCQQVYGDNVHGVQGEKATDANCFCDSGYEWTVGQTACVKPKTFFDLPEVQIDNDLVARMKGRILLQVQEHGEAWYVNPESGKRYYMRDGSAAFEMMRSFGLGITDKDLVKIPSVSDTSGMKSSTSACKTNVFAKNVAGKILLQVEQHGEAWYVDPNKCQRIYLKDGETAYSVMRYLGLGITNSDWQKIPEGKI